MKEIFLFLKALPHMGKIPLTSGRMGSKHLPPLGIVLQTGFSSQLEEIPFAGLGWGPEVALSGTALVGSALLRGWGLAVPAPSLAGGARLHGFPRPTGGAGGPPPAGRRGERGQEQRTVLAPRTQLPFAERGLWWEQGFSVRVDLSAPLLGLGMNAATPFAGLRLSRGPLHQQPL